MKQATHAWMAIRAVGLLADDPETKGLAALLKPCLRSAAIGAWMPDLEDAKLGSGDIDNHVFKMAPYDGELSDRYITPKSDLLKRLGTGRAVSRFLKDDSSLDARWWGGSYMASPTAQQNIANRALALSTTLADDLITGDADVAKNLPRKFKLAAKLSPDERTRCEQAGLGFFMLSHFVADACMPCHCDKRYLSSFDGKLHPDWEGRIEKKVGKAFTDEQMSEMAGEPAGLLEAAAELDAAFGITFDGAIPVIKDGDVWKETVAVCRGSFAVANAVANPKEYPFGSRKVLSVKDIQADPAAAATFDKATAAVVHDGVLNIAIVWKFVWGRFGGK